MVSKLPPLNALRAFEAAARHEGFIGASDELHVTRGAVSRHVKLLEAYLGAQLFRRHPNGLELTAAGRQLLPVLTDAFTRIADEASRLRRSANELRVICPPATSIRWLLPRLPDFQRKHPDIELRLTTDFHSDGRIDVFQYDIGFSVAHWPVRAKGLEVDVLFDVLLSPACAPSLLENGPPLEKPEDLANHVLLHETTKHEDWLNWTENFGITGIDVTSGSNFPNLDMAVKAAVLGAGVVMADMVLCADELESGALVRPFPDMVCPSRYGGVCLIGPTDKWLDPKVKTFRDWAKNAATEKS